MKNNDTTTFEILKILMLCYIAIAGCDVRNAIKDNTYAIEQQTRMCKQ